MKPLPHLLVKPFPLPTIPFAQSREQIGVLLHHLQDGSEQPMAFVSKMMPKNKLYRAILDKGAGRIIFGFRKFYQYVYGVNIILKTDHEPLKFIFGSNRNLLIMIQSRLIRWSFFHRVLHTKLM